MTTLRPGESLEPGQQLSSSNRVYDLSFQGDGNLVLYRHDAGVTTVLWHSGTPWYETGDLSCSMQGDGNLVLYCDGKAYWATNTFMGQTSLVLENSGELKLVGPPVPMIVVLSQADPNPVPVPPHFDPASLTLEQIATFRGGMWTARTAAPYGGAPSRFGPRMNQASNIAAMCYIEHLPEKWQRDRMIADYKLRGYTHAVTGSPIDPDGYHHQYPEYPGPLTQAWWDHTLTCYEEWYDAPGGPIIPAFFALPEEWDVDQAERELGSFFRQERAQQLIRMVFPAWEPNWASAKWVRVMTWLTRTFPHAVWGVHLTPNHSAPGLSSEIVEGVFEESHMWKAIAHMVHVFAEQSDCWFRGSAEDRAYWTGMWNPRMIGGWDSRFTGGYNRWPTNSAWPKGGIWPFPAEFLSYDCYWKDRPELDAQRIGDAAIAMGARGSLDGLTIAR